MGGQYMRGSVYLWLVCIYVVCLVGFPGLYGHGVWFV